MITKRELAAVATHGSSQNANENSNRNSTFERWAAVLRVVEATENRRERAQELNDAADERSAPLICRHHPEALNVDSYFTMFQNVNDVDTVQMGFRRCDTMALTHPREASLCLRIRLPVRVWL